MIELSYLASLQMSASSISKPTPKQMPFLSSLKGTMKRLLPSNNSKPTSTQVLPSSNSQGTMQQMPHCPRCHRHNHVYLYKSYDDDDLDHRLAAAEDRDDSLDRLDDRLRAIAVDRFRLSGVVLLLLGSVFLGGFLRRVAGVALVVVGLVLARDRAAGLVNHAPAAARGARDDSPAAC
ncbi:unnamed protein product, partial [Rotaria sordida]